MILWTISNQIKSTVLENYQTLSLSFFISFSGVDRVPKPSPSLNQLSKGKRRQSTLHIKMIIQNLTKLLWLVSYLRLGLQHFFINKHYQLRHQPKKLVSNNYKSQYTANNLLINTTVNSLPGISNAKPHKQTGKFIAKSNKKKKKTFRYLSSYLSQAEVLTENSILAIILFPGSREI